MPAASGTNQITQAAINTLAAVVFVYMSGSKTSLLNDEVVEILVERGRIAAAFPDHNVV